MNQTLVTRLLMKQGHSVVLACDGLEVLTALDRESFDLALMDVQMPEMDGFEVTAAIRERERVTGTHLSIIAVTALRDAGRSRKMSCCRNGRVCE